MRGVVREEAHVIQCKVCGAPLRYGNLCFIHMMAWVTSPEAHRARQASATTAQQQVAAMDFITRVRAERQNARPA